ncbi:MAG TPA: dipeptidase [Bryobacteraceae bacterium]|jgi:acetylornithine deacetylase/succinyl-diaminopimelate desuccinylase-like protein|nr:dipeptidase [Bryobacteraceae bacterium]
MNYYEQNRQAFLDGLQTFLRIPSISTLSEHKPDIRRAAEFVRNELSAAGLQQAQLIEGEGNPLVYAEWTGAAGKPTLLLYGHYDVQPPDPLDEWKSPPFEPSVRGNDIFARGSSDDKGQTYILMKAVEGLLKTKGRLPVNVKFLIEGEEETGGEHIEAYVSSKPARLKSDAAVICDTEMFAPELPTICVGLRGIVYAELHVEGANHDLHSGIYGGAAPNPMQATAEILTALKDRNGHILIPGFYDRVVPPSAKEREAWARLPFDEAEYTQKEMGARELVGEPEIPLFERLWARPTLEVHGIRGGFTGEGAKTVIPARAVTKISARLVADQRPDEATAQLKEAVRRATPKGVTAEWKPIHSAAPSLVNPDNPFVRAAAEAMGEVFGKQTVYIRSGGSIPIVGLFDQCLGIPSVMLGFGLPDDNLHAPNEKLHLPNFYRGIEAVAHYLEMLGR